jgi:serine/threonine-protein kinase
MGDSDSLPAEVGRYRIDRMLGQGAMGRVLLAHDPVLDRGVAIKMLRADLGISPEMRAGLLTRMRHEARAVARVAHPNIVTLHDMIEDPDLGLCLVFECVSGETLKDRIADGPSPPLDVARVAREIGSALSLAHDAGVLHRDVKPENIMLAPHGAKITDFGIARVPDSTLTRAGGLLGTPAYSAPETISGSNFSASSDQFSLAATLYEAISGTRAFPGDDAVTVAARIGTEEPKPIAQAAGLDPRVDQVLGRALSKDPSRRFTTCEAFGEALAAALEIGTMQDHRSVPDMAVPAQPPRPMSLWASVALGGAAVGALIAILLLSMLKPPAPTPFEIVAARSASASTPNEPAPEPTVESPPVRARFKPREPSSDPDEPDASSSKDAGAEVMIRDASRPEADPKLDAARDARASERDGGSR